MAWVVAASLREWFAGRLAPAAVAPEYGACVSRTTVEVIVVGAGIAGLACARALADAGIAPLVVGGDRHVGGRCATRFVDDQPIDHGLAFFHGTDPGFFGALEEVEGATRLEGWPVRVEGKGAPCQPRAFEAHERRLAFADGVRAFPEHLARGIDVRLATTIERLAFGDHDVNLVSEGGEGFAARTVVLALPVERAAALLAPVVEESPEIAAAGMLLALATSVPSLTVIAGYPLDAPEPPWDACYPDTSAVIGVATHDSSKRAGPRFRGVVYQCLPRWSRLHQAEPAEVWSAAVLAEAARLVGAWAARPSWAQAHVWPLARVAGGSELAGPMLLAGPGRSRLGLAGDLFAASGGAQASWRSGTDLAARILGKELR